MTKKISSDRRYQTQRIRSIDVVKGICICFIMWGHMMEFWMLEQDLYLWIRKWAEIFGPGIFLFIAGVNQCLSIERRYHRGHSFSRVVSYTSRNYIFFALIGLLSNIFINLTFGKLNIFTVFEYRILFGLAFNVIISWPLVVMRVSTYKRVLIGTAFLVIGAVGYANGWTESAPYLFSHGRLPPFPNAGLAILGSVFGYYLFKVNLQSSSRLIDREKDVKTPIDPDSSMFNSSRDSKLKFLIVSIAIGSGLLMFTFTPGLGYIPDPINMGTDYYLSLNPYIWGTIESDGFPFIANIHSIFWTGYCIGASIIAITLLWWVLDVHRHARNTRLFSVLEFYGTYSFSCYIYHPLFLAITLIGFHHSLPYYMTVPLGIIAIGVIGAWIHLCVKYWNGNGTIERARASTVKWLGKSQFFTNLQGK